MHVCTYIYIWIYITVYIQMHHLLPDFRCQSVLDLYSTCLEISQKIQYQVLQAFCFFCCFTFATFLRLFKCQHLCSPELQYSEERSIRSSELHPFSAKDFELYCWSLEQRVEEKGNLWSKPNSFGLISQMRCNALFSPRNIYLYIF